MEAPPKTSVASVGCACGPSRSRESLHGALHKCRHKDPFATPIANEFRVREARSRQHIPTYISGARGTNLIIATTWMSWLNSRLVNANCPDQGGATNALGSPATNGGWGPYRKRVRGQMTPMSDAL